MLKPQLISAWLHKDVKTVYIFLFSQVNCSVTMPYWDWSRYAAKPFLAPVWNTTVLGGDGDFADSYCVANGPFRSGQWSVRPNGTCLKRQFSSNTFPTMMAVNLALAIAPQNFSQFEIAMRGSMHAAPMCDVGGTMCTHSSSNAPEFWLFNAYVDSLWWRWQNRSSAHADAFFPTVADQLSGTNGLRPRDLTKSSQLPGGVCVTYQWPLPTLTGSSTTQPPTTSPAATTSGDGVVIINPGSPGTTPGEGEGTIFIEPQEGEVDLMETQASQMSPSQLSATPQVTPLTPTSPKWVDFLGMNATEYQFWQQVNIYLGGTSGSASSMTSSASQQAGVSINVGPGQSGSSGGAGTGGAGAGPGSSIEANSNEEDLELFDLFSE